MPLFKEAVSASPLPPQDREFLIYAAENSATLDDADRERLFDTLRKSLLGLTRRDSEIKELKRPKHE